MNENYLRVLVFDVNSFLRELPPIGDICRAIKGEFAESEKSELIERLEKAKTREEVLQTTLQKQ